LQSIGLFLKVRHGGWSNRNSYEPNWARFAEFDAAWKEKLHRKSLPRQPNLSQRPANPVTWEVTALSPKPAEISSQRFADELRPCAMLLFSEAANLCRHFWREGN
jgi:hypothetical protein